MNTSIDEQDFADEALNEALDEDLDEELEPEPSPEELAFARIARQAEAGLADCDRALLRIQAELAAYDRQKAAQAEQEAAGSEPGNEQGSESDNESENESAIKPEKNARKDEARLAEEQYGEQYSESRQESENTLAVWPENMVQRAARNQEAYEREAFVRARLREARAAAANASWQLLLGFGLSFAVRVGILGIWLGGWIDRHWLGDTGLGAAGIILLVIGYSFYMLYADLRRSDRRWQEERERLQAEAEADFAAGKRK